MYSAASVSIVLHNLFNLFFFNLEEFISFPFPSPFYLCYVTLFYFILLSWTQIYLLKDAIS